MNDALDQAEAALRGGKPRVALDLLEDALRTDMPANLHAEATSMLGMAMLATGNPQAAIGPLQDAVSLDPAEGMFRYNYARGLEQVGRLDDAIVQHREAVRLSGGQLPLLMALVQTLARAGRFAEGAQWIEPAVKHASTPPVARRLLVKCLQGAGDLHAALDYARPLVPRTIAQADAQGRADALTMAQLLSGAMYYSEAADIARALVQSDPADAQAAATLAPLALWMDGPEAAERVIENAIEHGRIAPELLVQLLGYNETVAPERLEDAERMATDESLPAAQRGELLLALAQYHDRQGDAERAWTLANQGNEVDDIPARRDWRASLDKQIGLYRRIGPVEPAEDSLAQLYLCGAPRSGQSLIQSVLCAAPQIASAGERGALLAHLLWRADEIAAMPDRECAALFAQLAEADNRGLRRLVGTPQLAVDKNPSNLVIAGNLARLHPLARFAVSLRDPADVAVSIYLRRFSPAYDYARDLGSIIDHLEFLADAIAAWRSEGVAIRAIDYGRFVSDPAGYGMELFGWLGIEWNERYLDPASRTTPVPTFSAAQVRKAVGAHSSRGSSPYADRLATYAIQLDRIREKQAALLAQSC